MMEDCEDVAKRELALEELRSVRLLDRRVSTTVLEIELLETQINRVTSAYDKLIVQGGRHDRGDAIAKLIDLRAECNSRVDDYADKKAQVLRRIDAIDDPLLGEVLYLRYVQGLEWEQVAKNVQYSEGHIYRLGNRALQAYTEVSCRKDDSQ